MANNQDYIWNSTLIWRRPKQLPSQKGLIRIEYDIDDDEVTKDVMVVRATNVVAQCYRSSAVVSMVAAALLKGEQIICRWLAANLGIQIPIAAIAYYPRIQQIQRDTLSASPQPY